MRQLVFIIKADYTYESYSRPRITAKEKHSDEIVVISNDTPSLVVSATFALENANGTNYTQYLVPSSNKGSAYIDTDSPLYATYANANVWSASINQNILSAISKFHRGRVGIAFNFKTKILGSLAITFVDYFGQTSDLTESYSGDVGDYYLCNVGSYASAVAGVTFAYGQAAVWNGATWDKVGTYKAIANTTTVWQNVDPSVIGVAETTDDEILEDVLDALGVINDNLDDIKDAIDENASDIDALDTRLTTAEGDIDNIEDGTTVVGKATRDKNGNDIVETYETKADAATHKARTTALETFKDITAPATYETKADADTHKARTTALENANMIKSITRSGSNLVTITYYNNTTSTVITLAELKAFIGEATQSLRGLMSAQDKTDLYTLMALFDADGDSVVNTIQEILHIFENYPEGANILEALNDKVEKIEGKGLSENDYTDIDKK